MVKETKRKQLTLLLFIKCTGRTSCVIKKRITKTYNGSTQVTENGRIITCSKELISHHIHSSELHTTLFLPTSEGSLPNARKRKKRKRVKTKKQGWELQESCNRVRCLNSRPAQKIHFYRLCTTLITLL